MCRGRPISTLLFPPSIPESSRAWCVWESTSAQPQTRRRLQLHPVIADWPLSRDSSMWLAGATNQGKQHLVHCVYMFSFQVSEHNSNHRHTYNITDICVCVYVCVRVAWNSSDTFTASQPAKRLYLEDRDKDSSSSCYHTPWHFDSVAQTQKWDRGIRYLHRSWQAKWT